MNIQQLMKQAQAMQKELGILQKKHEETKFEGVAGGGMVKATINGKGRLHALQIDTSLLTPDEKETLEDLIIVAINNAKSNADAQWDAQAKAMGLPEGMAGFGG